MFVPGEIEGGLAGVSDAEPDEIACARHGGDGEGLRRYFLVGWESSGFNRYTYRKRLLTGKPATALWILQISLSHFYSMTPKGKLSAEDRAELFQTISELPLPQFEKLVFALEVPRGNMPKASATPGGRTAHLLEWVESPMGTGLSKLQEVLDRVLGKEPEPPAPPPDSSFTEDLGNGVQHPSEDDNQAGSLCKVNNRFPDSVFVKLHSIPTQYEVRTSSVVVPAISSSTSNKSIELTLTIRFGDQRMKVPGGSVWFGLKRGELKLNLENGKIPLETQELTRPYELEIEVIEREEKGEEIEFHATATSGVDIGGNQKNIKNTSVQKTRMIYQTGTRGTEVNPVWIFETRTTELILIGQLSQVKLGTVEVAAHPCLVDATVEVRRQDIQLTQADGLLLPKNFGQYKTALLQRAFCLRHIAPKLQPYLSRIERQL